jgi:hypothetical protein
VCAQAVLIARACARECEVRQAGWMMMMKIEKFCVVEISVFFLVWSCACLNCADDVNRHERKFWLMHACMYTCQMGMLVYFGSKLVPALRGGACNFVCTSAIKS